MKKLILLLAIAGLFAACDSGSKGKDKYDREKTSSDAREKDDYRNNGDKANTDSKNPSANDDKSTLSSKTGIDESGNSETVAGWPQSERGAFMKSCEREAMGGGRDKLTAQSYCQCMLDKMEAQYPDIKVAAKLTREELNRFGMKNRDNCLEEH